MFNGIILNTGKIKVIKYSKQSILIGVQSDLKFKKKDIGSSICCDGVCLTLTKISKGLIFFYISNETIKRSNFKKIKVGKIINLEKSLDYGQKISGHFTQGHVDTTAIVKKINLIDKSWSLNLEIQDRKFEKYLEEKASISINGVSLTVSKILKNKFKIWLIPHTLKLTNLSRLSIGDVVNIEIDILSKYVKKYINEKKKI